MKNNFQKIILLSTAVLLLAVGCNKQASSPAKPSSNTAVAPAPGPAVPQITKSDAKIIKVRQAVYEGNKKFSGTFSVADGQDALTLLRSFRTIDTKSYSGAGDFVVSIDGIVPDSKHFWEFFVNGKSSNVGAGSYKVKNGDLLEWKLSVIH